MKPISSQILSITITVSTRNVSFSLQFTIENNKRMWVWNSVIAMECSLMFSGSHWILCYINKEGNMTCSIKMDEKCRANISLRLFAEPVKRFLATTKSDGIVAIGWKFDERSPGKSDCLPDGNENFTI